MNPYEPSEPDNRPRKPEGIQIDFKEFFLIFFVVIIGTPLIYATVLEMVERYGYIIYNSVR